MYASTAVNNDSAGIPQAYVNQAYRGGEVSKGGGGGKSPKGERIS